MLHLHVLLVREARVIARVRAAVRRRLAAYADANLTEELAAARTVRDVARRELIAACADADRQRFVAARLDAELVKARGTAERLQHDLRAAEADVRRLAAELTNRPARPLGSADDGGYWRRKWIEDRRALTLLQDRLLTAERRGEPPPPPGSRLHTSPPARRPHSTLLTESS